MRRVLDFLHFEDDTVKETTRQIVRVVRKYNLEISESFNGNQILNLNDLINLNIVSRDTFQKYWKEISGVRYDPVSEINYVNIKTLLLLIYLSSVTNENTVTKHSTLRKVKTATSILDLPQNFFEAIDEHISKFLTSEDYDNHMEGIDERYNDSPQIRKEPEIGKYYTES